MVEEGAVAGAGEGEGGLVVGIVEEGIGESEDCADLGAGEYGSLVEEIGEEELQRM